MLGGYYRFYPGDYLRDTSGLSLIEHGAYNLLLHHYYSTDGCLAGEKPRLYRLCRVTTPEEQRAVDYVLEKYFPVIEGKLVNKRADKEMERRRRFLDEQSRKGRLGGRPRKKPNESRGKAGEKPRGKPGESREKADLDLDLDLRSKDQDQSLSSESSDAPPGNGFRVEDMVRLWNEGIDFYSTDKEVKIPKVKKMHDKRKEKARRRIKDCLIDEALWRTIINKIHQSAFLSGEIPSKGHPCWVADFDFVIASEANITKILEGGYQ